MKRNLIIGTIFVACFAALGVGSSILEKGQQWRRPV